MQRTLVFHWASIQGWSMEGKVGWGSNVKHGAAGVVGSFVSSIPEGKQSRDFCQNSAELLALRGLMEWETFSGALEAFE